MHTTGPSSTAGDRRHIAYAVAASERDAAYEMARARYALEVSTGLARSAHAIPAFARKYGMKCSACHTAVLSLAGLPAGTYRYYCLPHLGMKMVGRITLRP